MQFKSCKGNGRGAAIDKERDDANFLEAAAFGLGIGSDGIGHLDF